MVEVRRQLSEAARRPGRRAGRLGQEAADGGGAARPPIVDVWSRTQPKYRRRAILLLLTNTVLFAGLNVFAFWLHHGRLFDFSWASYERAVVGKSLLDIVRYPISVQQVPLMIVILGLTLAVMIAVPIVVAQLYRFGTSLLFVAQVCFLGHLPTLSGFLLLSCYIAGGRRLRLPFRFASAVLGLIPITVYFLIATKGVDLSEPDAQTGLFATVLATVVVVATATLIAHQGGRALAGGTLGAIVATGLVPATVWAVLVPSREGLLLDPAARLLLYSPWVLAVIAAGVFAALVLTIAWIVNYRPGAIAPLLAVLFAVPVVLFETQVGRDELQYRLLEARYGPGSRTHFREQEVRSRIFELAQRRWRQDPSLDLQAIMQNITLAWEFELEPLGELKDQMAETELTRLASYQYEVVRACDEFCRARPKSRYIPNVLYMKGRALDMRVDMVRFRREGVLSFYDDFPNPVSEQTWATLVTNYPESVPSSVARYKLAVFGVRRGQVDQASRLLKELIEKFDVGRAEARPRSRASKFAEVFARKPAASTLELQVRTIVDQARELLELVEANRDDALYGQKPLAELLRLDRRHRFYREHLRRLLRVYPHSLLEDNLAVRLALTAESMSRRIGRLERILQRYRQGDAVAEALFRLGELLEADARTDEAQKTYRRVVQEHRGSVWARRASRRLAALALYVSRP